MSFIVALLGAESTGKTTLAEALGRKLEAPGRRVAVVGEYLREFCASHLRTPHRDEQRGIADEQTRRIDAAAASHDLVIADTSALMIAVYSDQVFRDTGLYAHALAAHGHCDLTLLTALDLPWQADGLQRDGPQVREPVDAKVRAALAQAGMAYGVVYGFGEARVEAAHAAVQRALSQRMAGTSDAGNTDEPAADTQPGSRWQWHCDRCGDADCERHALRGALAPLSR